MKRRLLALLLLAAPAGAQDWDPPGPPGETCVPYDDRYSAAPLFRIRVARQNLFDQARLCPATGDCPWRRAGYLVVGDTVLASAPRRGFRCAYFGTRRGTLITGFLPEAALAPEPEAPAVDAAFLRGRWNGFDGMSHVTFAGGDAALRITGEAFWRGFTTVNYGELDSPVQLEPSRFTAHEPIAECTVTGTRRGPYLVLRDNNQCGGHNVRFYGIFMRQR
ncbi:hypothetical protein [Plastoroseomonas arctica]|uniref:Uncharacterized protein n=1 Tax=Plastoroseomonas arctica TaxID=1509237 RepID=A0AAF1JWK7_9PROT|nr:hypothetical protein [Plastoroseomonas arctica]MBR0655312.1 hypothetical protein [Plastoroseomonas arctica]